MDILITGWIELICVPMNTLFRLKIIMIFLLRFYISITGFDIRCSYMGRVKRKSAFEHAQNAHIQIILRMRKVPSWPLLLIHTFYSIQ